MSVNDSHQPRLAGLAISARLNGLWKTLASLSPNLAKFCPFVVSFVPLAKRSQCHDGSRSYVFVEFAAPITICNLLGGSFLISHLRVQ